MIHVDPRFTRTSAVADKHLRIRTGTDVAYFGGLINYVLQNNLLPRGVRAVRHERRLRRQGGYASTTGSFNGVRPAEERVYDDRSAVDLRGRRRDGFAKVDIDRTRARCST